MHAIAGWFAWFLTPTGRLLAGLVLWAVIWVLKHLPGAKRLLSTDKRRAAAAVVLALAPVVPLLWAAAVPAEQAWLAAAQILAEAMGLQGLLKAVLPASMATVVTAAPGATKAVLAR